MLSDRIRAITELLRTLATEVEALETAAEGTRMVDAAVPQPSGLGALVVMGDRIERCVCERYAIPLQTMLSKERSQHVTTARQVAMYFCREMTDASFPAIGNRFNRHHTTVIHAHDLVAQRAAHDPQFAVLLATLRQAVMAQNDANHNGVGT